MRFARHLTHQPANSFWLLAPALGVGLIFVFLLLAFPLFKPNEAKVVFPKTITSDVLQNTPLIISITAEEVLYCNNRIVTLKELRQALASLPLESRTVLIKADRRAAVGRLVDIWYLCRELGIERINLATSQEK